MFTFEVTGPIVTMLMHAASEIPEVYTENKLEYPRLHVQI